jgi:GNAT superfamily N-acetyltransferase
MRMRKLTAQQSVKLWRAFFDAHGAEQMERSYHWGAPPPVVGRDEQVFSFQDQVAPRDGESGDPAMTLVGWGSIQLRTWDALDDEAFLNVGVFPPWERRGYSAKIYGALIERARKLGADCASQIVFKENEAHHARVMRAAADEKSGWIHAGERWYPGPGHDFFVYPFDDDKVHEKKETKQ